MSDPVFSRINVTKAMIDSSEFTPSHVGNVKYEKSPGEFKVSDMILYNHDLVLYYKDQINELYLIITRLKSKIANGEQENSGFTEQCRE